MTCSQELSKNLLHPRTKRTIGDGLLQEDINNMQRSSIDSSCHTTLKFHLTEQSSFLFQLLDQRNLEHDQIYRRAAGSFQLLQFALKIFN